MKKALITGISGQDGSYLAEYLLSLGYEVHGIVRRNSVCEHQQSRLDHIRNDIQVYYGDLLDVSSLDRAMKEVQPDEIYNLAAQSHVRISFDVPQFTAQTNALGALNVLQSCRDNCPDAHVYQASSSEMFGNSVDEDGCQRESTPMHPVSPYGCAKLYAYSIMRNYRKSYKMFAANGILFNHESPRRGSNFVTNKVVKGAVAIKKGQADKLELGNMDSHRDWGHSRDYVKAMHAILNHSEPDDFCIATGRTHSIRDLCECVFSRLDMDYRDYVVQNPKYMRPEELKYLKGDPTKARVVLGWEPESTFESMLDEMIDFWMEETK
jgi:GDPmannose 4,6-dehydratase